MESRQTNVMTFFVYSANYDYICALIKYDMKNLISILILLVSLLTAHPAVATTGSTALNSLANDVVVDFLVPASSPAITNNMAIANITVDRAYYEIYWTVSSVDDSDFFFAGSSGQANAGAGTFTIKASTPSGEPVVLNEGYLYTFTFHTCEFGWDSYQEVASFEVTGSGEAAEQFSDIIITSFDGTPGPLGYQFQNKYSVTFSAPVNQVKAFAPMGMDGSQIFTVSKTDSEGCEWSIDCSQMSNTEGAFELHIQARDAATGLRLLGTYKLDHSFIYTINVSGSGDGPSVDPELPEGAVVLTEGDNELPLYSAVTAVFKATNDCKVIIEASDIYEVTYNNQNYQFTYIPTSYPANLCEIDNVTAGSMVTLNSSFVFNPLVRITTIESGAVVPVTVNQVIPAENTSDFWKNDGQLNILFNKPVLMNAVKLWVNEQSYDVEIVSVTSSICLNIGTCLNQLLRNGILQVGDPFQIRVTGLCDANDHNNLYNADGNLELTFVAPQPQYSMLSATVNGQTLTTAGLNDYYFLSYYVPDGDDGVFTLEFEAEIGEVANVKLQMGNRDLDAQGKYYEGTIDYSIEGSKLIVDARGVLRTLNILFPAIVEEDQEEGGTENPGLGVFDSEHITLRVSSVKDMNGNYFRSQQAGNVGSYSFYMNYKQLMETIHLDGDNKMAGDDVWSGETIRLWLSNAGVQFDGIKVTYLTLLDEDSYDSRSILVNEFDIEQDPYEGIVISFVMPEMPEVAIGQTIHVALNNALTSDGMPHDLGIDFRAGDPKLGIEQIKMNNDNLIWRLDGTRAKVGSSAPGFYIVNGKKLILQ